MDMGVLYFLDGIYDFFFPVFRTVLGHVPGLTTIVSVYLLDV